MRFLRVRRAAKGALRVGAALTIVSAVGLAATLPAAGEVGQADEPADETIALPEVFLDGYGWWSKAQQLPGGGGAPAAPPCPSSPASQCSVGPPADGIYVVYDYDAVVPGTVTGPIANVPAPPAIPQPPSPAPTVSAPLVLGPSAFGAVRYVVPEGAESQLSLRILSRATTTPGGTDPTAGRLFACSVSVGGWAAAQNGRYDQAPKYDCTTADEGDLQSDTVVFDLPASFVQNGVIDVAIVPAGSVDQGDRPFQMALGAPLNDSLIITNADELVVETPFAEEDFSFDDPLTDFAADESFSDELLTDDFAFDAGGTSFGEAAGAPVARPPRLAVPAGNFANPFRADASRGERLMAVLLLVGMAGALWWVGGKQVRAPRLLGSLGHNIPIESEAVRTGGIGRFARIRGSEKAPRLF